MEMSLAYCVYSGFHLTVPPCPVLPRLVLSTPRSRVSVYGIVQNRVVAMNFIVAIAHNVDNLKFAGTFGGSRVRTCAQVAASIIPYTSNEYIQKKKHYASLVASNTRDANIELNIVE